MSSEDEKAMFQKIMDGESPDMEAQEKHDKVAMAIMDGEFPEELAQNGSDDDDIAKKILDGELTSEDLEENVNKGIGKEIMGNAQSDATDEQKEMARKIMNGEI